jgi:long-chain acyl-CoA synthetase
MEAPATRTIAALLHRNATEFGDLPALTGLDTDGDTRTWAQLADEVAAVSCGLARFGLEPGGRLLIMMTNRPEHWIADLAAAQLGGVPCTLYATLSPDQMRYIAQHSQAQVLVLEGAAEVARWRPILADLPHLRRVVVVDEAAIAEEAAADDSGRFVSLRQVHAEGAAAHRADPDAYERRWRAIRPEQPVTLLYTSGTTGEPKGVLISHNSVFCQGDILDATLSLPPHSDSVAYLPLAHIAERVLGIYIPLYRASHVHTCGDPTQVVAALKRVRPAAFFGVPRVWEKMVAGIRAHLDGADERVRGAFAAASGAALEAHRLREAGTAVPDELTARAAALDAAVLRPIRASLGLDNLVWAGSGAAPIPVEVLLFLAGIGVHVIEVWGMTETTGAGTLNLAGKFRTGSVGQVAPGMELRIADDGEILARGPLICLGYLKEDGTVAPVTDADGWLATGDIGTLDADGFVTITDRKKELIITSGGKNIAPAQIENLLRAHPLIGQAVAIGDRRPYVTALLVLDEETAPVWARTRGIAETDPAKLARTPEVLAEMQSAVDAANAKLARPEQVKAFRVLPASWTPQSGEVTPTLKLRRRIINERYAEAVEDLYRSGATS